jgi:hypothetical protein
VSLQVRELEYGFDLSDLRHERRPTQPIHNNQAPHQCLDSSLAPQAIQSSHTQIRYRNLSIHSSAQRGRSESVRSKLDGIRFASSTSSATLAQPMQD